MKVNKSVFQWIKRIYITIKIKQVSYNNTQIVKVNDELVPNEMITTTRE